MEAQSSETTMRASGFMLPPLMGVRTTNSCLGALCLCPHFNDTAYLGDRKDRTTEQGTTRKLVQVIKLALVSRGVFRCAMNLLIQIQEARVALKKPYFFGRRSIEFIQTKNIDSWFRIHLWDQWFKRHDEVPACLITRGNLNRCERRLNPHSELVLHHVFSKGGRSKEAHASNRGNGACRNPMEEDLVGFVGTRAPHPFEQCRQSESVVSFCG